MHATLVTMAMAALLGVAIIVLVNGLGRRRPGFAIGPAAMTGFGLRILAASLISLTPVARDLRGGDELIFQDKANLIAETPVGSGDWSHALLQELHVYVIALQRYFFDAPELAMRVTQVGIAVIGLVLLAAAVYELAGPRASVLAMWLLALEPASIFFSSLLHKEANMLLAIGLIALGGAKVWKRGQPRNMVFVVAGCLIAVATRQYAGWFLIAAGAAILLHAGLRAEHRSAIRSLALVASVVLFAAVTAPVVLKASTSESLEKNLQRPQEHNTSGNSNLKLEEVDFSTRTAVVVNLPKRAFDVVFRPFPWQLGNISQGLGLLGTAAAYLALYFLARTLYRCRGSIMARAGPLIYLAAFLTMAYALSAGNAGTGFRYRVQIVAMIVCIVVTLWRPSERTSESRGQLPRLAPSQGAGVPSSA